MIFNRGYNLRIKSSLNAQCNIPTAYGFSDDSTSAAKLLQHCYCALNIFLDNSVSADPRLRKGSPCGRFLLVLVKQERSFESNNTAVH